jgi:exopolysaccharide biosynthesis polyprenyl glycosylphosphotransferase
VSGEESNDLTPLPRDLTIVSLASEGYRDRFSLSLARTLAQSGASRAAIDAAGGAGTARRLVDEPVETSNEPTPARPATKVGAPLVSAPRRLVTQMAGRSEQGSMWTEDRHSVAPVAEAVLRPPPGLSGAIRGQPPLLARHATSVSRFSELRGPNVAVRSDKVFRSGLVLADVVALAGALIVTHALAPHSLRVSWASLVSIPIALLLAKLLGLYDRDESLINKTTLDEIPKLLQMATIVSLLVWIADGFIATGALRPGALSLWAWLTILLIAARTCIRLIASRIVPVERCLFVGDEASAEAVRSRLYDRRGINAMVVAHLDLDKIAPWLTDSGSQTRLAEISDLAQVLDVHRAIIAPRATETGEIPNLVLTLRAIGVRVSILPRPWDVVGSSFELDELRGIALMGLKPTELTPSSIVLKRAFDLAGASLGLLLCGPFLPIIAIAIKLETRGPVFFRQRRVGRHGKLLQILKFRTMVADADAMVDTQCHKQAEAGLFKLARDPRITRVGRVLRSSSLDELPLLLNVLKGNMSLVGPRPLLLDEREQPEGWHCRRLELTPGLIGPWQMLDDTRMPLAEMVAFDYLYIVNWSLWTDIKIILRTVPHMLARHGF